jgi:hypothetical protein
MVETTIEITIEARTQTNKAPCAGAARCTRADAGWQQRRVRQPGERAMTSPSRPIPVRPPNGDTSAGTIPAGLRIPCAERDRDDVRGPDGRGGGDDARGVDDHHVDVDGRHILGTVSAQSAFNRLISHGCVGVSGSEPYGDNR